MGMKYVGTGVASQQDIITKQYPDDLETYITTTLLGGLKFVKLTQAAYNASSKDANTVYIIVG